jgi:hypothetical protein
MQQQPDKKYAVFHIPRAWLDNEDIVFLVNHKYATAQAEEALGEIVMRLKRLGYMRVGDGDRMVHDYLCFFIQDMLDKNEEIYLTEEEIRGSEQILRFFEWKTPDLLIKTKPGTFVLTAQILFFCPTTPLLSLQAERRP